MNDKFLTECREAPGREFSATLYGKLAHPPQEVVGLNLKRWQKITAVITVALLLPFMLVMTFSPSARAAIQGVIQTIGGVKFDVSDQYPGGSGPAQTIPSQQMTLAEAQTALPFRLRLPAWAPDGYVIEEVVTVTRRPNAETIAACTWLGVENRMLLTISNAPSGLGPDYQIPVGPNSISEVQIHGQPAALVQGGWDANTRTWGADGVITLQWIENGLSYALMGVTAKVNPEDLVRMAESIP